MCLVAASWWSCWSSYVALTKQDLLRVPERSALGLGEIEGSDHAQAIGDAVDPPAGNGPGGLKVAAGTADPSAIGVVNGHQDTQRAAQNDDQGGGTLRDGNDRNDRNDRSDRPGPAMLAGRPHEMDNSSLQVRFRVLVPSPLL